MKTIWQLLLRLYPMGLFIRQAKRRSTMRSIWLRRFFKACGDNVLFGKIGYVCGLMYMTIGSGCRFGDGFWLTAWDSHGTQSPDLPHLGKIEEREGRFVQQLNPELTIGDNCNFGAYNHITCANRITIGNNLLTGKWVTITDNSHGGWLM